MVQPASQHLYVMQNEFGLIKIGRSIAVETRRNNLQQTERCKIEIVAVFDLWGSLEETIHLELEEFRLIGVWFAGDDEARAAIEEVINPDAPFVWPFTYDEPRAEEWYDHLSVVRAASYINKELYRTVRDMKGSGEPSWVHDSRIHSALHLARTGQRAMISIETRNAETVVVEHREDDTESLVPAYTATVANALLVWPEDIRPASWEGTALDCCIAALEAVRRQLPKVPSRSHLKG